MFPLWGSLTRDIRFSALPIVAVALLLIVAAPVAAAAGVFQPDPGPDTDLDGVSDSSDLDDDNDGISDLDEGNTPSVCTDTDADGVCDHLDLDSDNDGISDLIEAGLSWGVHDLDRDGVVDPGGFVDDDSDGIDDSIEAIHGEDNGVAPVDTDLDGLADLRDLDSDADWIPDAVEAVPTAGYRISWGNDGDVRDDDSDGDGVWWAHDDRSGHGATFVDPHRSDDDPLPDYRDADADGDGIDDRTESQLVADTVPTYVDPDGGIDHPSVDLAPFASGGVVHYRSLPVLDGDGDGLDDAVDPNPADPCVDPTAPGWLPIASNDCDRDGITVGQGDPDDFTAASTTTTTTVAPATTTTVPTTATSTTTTTEAVAPADSEQTPPGGIPGDDATDDGAASTGADEFDAIVELDPNVDDQAVAGASIMRVVGELVFDIDADGEITDATEPLDGAVVELWEAGADDAWQTDDDILVSSGVHDGGYELPAREGDFEVRVVVSSLPDGVVVDDVGSSRQAIGTARVRNGEVELQPFAYQPHSVCGVVTSDGLEFADAHVAVTDASGNTVQTRTDPRGSYCAVGSLESPLEPGRATVAASAIGVSVLTEVVIDDGEVVAPVLALDPLGLDAAADALGFEGRSHLSNLLIVSGMALFVAALAALVLRTAGNFPIATDPDDMIEW